MEKPKLTNTIAPLTPTTHNEKQQFAEATSNISTISRVNPMVRMETMDKITNVCRIIQLIKYLSRGKIHTHTLQKSITSILYDIK